MKNWQVWMEGFSATGESATAEFLGSYTTETFKDACSVALRSNGFDMANYSEKANTYWACGLFDNEGDARRGFG